MNERNEKNVLLKVRGLSRSFGGIRAVESLSFDAKQGDITGLIGPNGAGKTTVFNLITGVYLPDNGPTPAETATVKLNGENLVGKRPHEIVLAGVSRTFQNIRLFKRMTCIENVMTPLLVRGTSRPLSALFRTKFVREEEARARKMAMTILGEMGLAEAADRTASTLPYGLQRKLEIARALACMPQMETIDARSSSHSRLLLLDEPAAGMNEAETNELRDTILKVRKEFDVTMLLIEHHISLVMDVCNHIVVMDRGTLLAEGTPQDVRNDERVITAYLGRPRTRGRGTKGKNEHEHMS